MPSETEDEDAEPERPRTPPSRPYDSRQRFGVKFRRGCFDVSRKRPRKRSSITECEGNGEEKDEGGDTSSGEAVRCGT